ncbi:hypothetical protein HWV62_26737, partial [Athelia sp. TMB]
GEPGQVQYMKQSFTLNGFNSPVFCMAVDSTFNIAEFLSRKDSDMVQWAPGTMGGELTMEVSNRLFVKQDENKQHESVPIDLSVDPYGSLARLAVRDEVKYHMNVGYEEDAEDDVDHVNKQVKKMQVDDTV